MYLCFPGAFRVCYECGKPRLCLKGGGGGWNWGGFSCQEGKDTWVFGDWKPHHSPQLLMLARVWPEYQQKIGSVIQTNWIPCAAGHLVCSLKVDIRMWSHLYIWGLGWRKAALIFLNIFFSVFALNILEKLKVSPLFLLSLSFSTLYDATLPG